MTAWSFLYSQTLDFEGQIPYTCKNIFVKHHWAVVLFFFTVTQAAAQQTVQFSHYFFNRYEQNPAYAGMERSLSAFLTYRDQYSAFPGNPRVALCNVDLPLYKLNGAAGFSMQHTQAGLFRETTIRGSYNQVIGTQFGFLSLGGRLGFHFLQVDGNKLVTPEGEYSGGVNHNDPQLSSGVFSGFSPVWEVGAYFYSDTWQGGLNVGHLPAHAAPLGSGRFTRTTFGTLLASYNYVLSDQVKVQPAALLKWDKAFFQTDLTLLVNWEDQIMAGLGWRGIFPSSADALIVYLGTNIGQKYRVMYSFDLGISALASQHQGSHELTLSYNLQKLLGIGLPPPVIYNPRDL